MQDGGPALPSQAENVVFSAQEQRKKPAPVPFLCSCTAISTTTTEKGKTMLPSVTQTPDVLQVTFVEIDEEPVAEPSGTGSTADGDVNIAPTDGVAEERVPAGVEAVAAPHGATGPGPLPDPPAPVPPSPPVPPLPEPPPAPPIPPPPPTEPPPPPPEPPPVPSIPPPQHPPPPHPPPPHPPPSEPESGSRVASGAEAPVAGDAPEPGGTGEPREPRPTMADGPDPDRPEE